MRRLSLILLCGLIVVPAAWAAARAPGDGVLELKSVNADRVTIIGKGAIWGQIGKGTITIYDRTSDNSLTPYVSGAEVGPRPTLDQLGEWWRGTQVHFRSTDGAYKIVITGSDIDLTAVGIGKAYIDGNVSALDMGDYAVDDGDWQPVGAKPKLVTFGVQPVTATSGP